MLHGVEGVDQICDFFLIRIEQPLEEDVIEGSHVVPADDVVDPLVVDLTCRNDLDERLIKLHILGHLRILEPLLLDLCSFAHLDALDELAPQLVQPALQRVDGVELIGEQLLNSPALLEVAGSDLMVIGGEDVKLDLREGKEQAAEEKSADGSEYVYQHL